MSLTKQKLSAEFYLTVYIWFRSEQKESELTGLGWIHMSAEQTKGNDNRGRRRMFLSCHFIFLVMNFYWKVSYRVKF